MYTPVYNRLVGWLCAAIAVLGWVSGRVGEYMQISPLESGILMTVSVFAVLGSRSRIRYAVAVATVVGLALLVWGIAGSFHPHLFGVSAEPLENAGRILIGGWGVYLAVEDTLAWRQARLAA
ncbi:MAG: hypothetical protein K6T63_08440 [Alicyclobacillus herbarius]|uniref:hypothetical protein n=1 Tax=Alicyclobacillus herbarius TaxID=122960 RepID=UPI0004113556|nr:hypothetical protein [Alicyclobacillus herbarius]MCL6632652.1 hypothetical protein [Alicyclobacillus herbarius]